jgi:hypothetical protein
MFVVDASISKRAPSSWQWSDKPTHSRTLPRMFSVSHVVDEQGHNVTFVTKDAFVAGGGVIHTINAVSDQCQPGCTSKVSWLAQSTVG